MCMNIEVADDQADHVSEAIRIAISGGMVFNDFDDTVKALASGIWQVPVGEDGVLSEVTSHRTDQLRSEGVRIVARRSSRV